MCRAMAVLVPIPSTGKQLWLPDKLTVQFGGEPARQGRGGVRFLSLGELSPAFILRPVEWPARPPELPQGLFFSTDTTPQAAKQKFGTVKQFDFLFHKSGALEGQPRGYCFTNP